MKEETGVNKEDYAKYVKLAKSISKYDPSFDRILATERGRNSIASRFSYEKLIKMPATDPAWKELSRVYFSEPIYQRIILYYASLYLGYYYVAPAELGTGKINKKVLKREYNEVLCFLDDEINVEHFTNKVLIDILVEGTTFYFYDFINSGGKNILQMCKLPSDYCSIIGEAKNGQMPIFTLDLSFIDKVVQVLTMENTSFTLADILSKYPKKLRSMYTAWKNGGDKKVIITPGQGIGFSTYDGMPPFATILRQIVRIRKFEDVRDNYIEDSLQKILFQHVEVNSDGDPEIDLALAAGFHDNLKRIVKDMERVNAFTSLADLEVLDLADTSREQDIAFIDNFEDQLYNEAGVSRAIFNGDTAGLLEYSVAKDESFIWNLMTQISTWLSFISTVEIGTRNKKVYNFVVSYLPVSYRNREKMMDSYLKGAQYGYSKLLPQISIGVKQRHFESLLYLENDLLDVGSYLVPLESSHTQGAESVSDDAGGRPSVSTESKTDGTLEKDASI